MSEMDNDQASPFDEPELETVHRGLRFETKSERGAPEDDFVEPSDQPLEGVADDSGSVAAEEEVSAKEEDGTSVFGLPRTSRLPLGEDEEPGA